MNVERIATIDDPRLVPFRNLHQTNLTRGSGLFVVEGPLLVERLLASEYEATSILADERIVARLPAGVPEEVPVFVVPTGQIEGVVGFNFHRGILACGRRRAAKALADLIPAPVAEFARIPDLCVRLSVVVAVDIQDPGNLGGLLRNCAAFGVDIVLIGPHCADPFSRRALRVSMGASLRLALCESENLAADLDLLQYRGISLAATVLDPQAESLETATRPKRLAILFGNEAHGLDQELVARCDRRLTLPMPPGVDSLNVAVASGIFLYHLMRVAH